MSLKEKIRGLPRRTLTVLGEEVAVRGLSAADVIALEESVPHGPDGTRDRARLMAGYVVACTFNADGTPAFGQEDADWLQRDADFDALKALFNVAAELNGLGSEKNSATPPPSASPTA